MGENIDKQELEKKGPINADVRRGPDFILRLIDILSICLWGFIIINFAIILLAKPVGETFFDRLFEVTVYEYWNIQLLSFALILSFIQFLVSIFSLFLNSKRLKRKGDRIRISIVVSTFVSLFISISLTIFLILK